jgi:hypothetical protein
VLLILSVYHVVATTLQHGSILMGHHSPNSFRSPPMHSIINTLRNDVHSIVSRVAAPGPAPMDRGMISESTLMIFASSSHAFKESLHSLAATGFYGPVVFLCHASEDVCSSVNNSTLPLPATLPETPRWLTTHRIEGTQAARLSGQLMLTAAAIHLRTTSGSGQFTLLINSDSVRMCGRRGASVSLLGLPLVARRSAVYALSSNWTDEAARNISANHGDIDKGASNSITSSSFFFGESSNLLNIAATVAEFVLTRKIPTTTPINALLSYKHGDFRKALDAALEINGAELSLLPRGLTVFTKDCAASLPTVCKRSAVPILVDRSLCPVQTSSAVQSEVFTLYPGAETEVFRTLLQQLPLAVRRRWFTFRRSSTIKYVPQSLQASSQKTKKTAAQIAQRVCPLGLNNVMIGFPVGMTPARILAQFGDSLRVSTCTKLVLFVETAAPWVNAASKSQLQDRIVIVCIDRYESTHHCQTRGLHVCQHGVMSQWLAEQQTMNGIDVPLSSVTRKGAIHKSTSSSKELNVKHEDERQRSSIGRGAFAPLVNVGRIHLVMRIDLSIAHRRSSFLESIAVQSPVVLDGYDPEFIVILSTHEAFAAMNLGTPQIFDDRYTALKQLFGNEFARISLTLTVGDVLPQAATNDVPSLRMEPIRAPAPLAFGSLRAVARYIQLLGATITTRFEDDQAFTISRGALVDAAAHALLVCGFQASQFPFPVHVVTSSDLPDDAS